MSGATYSCVIQSDKPARLLKPRRFAVCCLLFCAACLVSVGNGFSSPYCRTNPVPFFRSQTKHPRGGSLIPTSTATLALLLSDNRHAFHTSITQIDFNAKEKTLEVSIRVFTDDLENTLSKENKGQRFRIENNDKNDPFVERYIRQHFKLSSPKGQLRAYTYIGKENEADATWVYIEIPLQEATLQGFTLQQDVLMDVFDDQVNIVNITQSGERKSYIYNVKKTVQALN